MAHQVLAPHLLIQLKSFYLPCVQVSRYFCKRDVLPVRHGVSPAKSSQTPSSQIFCLEVTDNEAI